MKKYVLFLGICLISIFSFNLNAKASDYCSRFYTDGLNSYVLRDDNQILIENVEFNTTFGSLLVQEKNYYWTYYYSKAVDYDLLLIYTVAQPSLKGTISSTTGRFNLINAYTYSSSYPVYEIKVGHDNTIQNVRKVLGTGALTSVNQWSTSYFWLSSWGTNNDSVNELSVMNTDTDEYVTFAKNEADYCTLPLTIPEPSFDVAYTQYNDQNAAVNVTINFTDYDLEKYDYFISYDEGQTYQNINSRVSYYEGKYIITRLDNFNVTAKIVEKETGEFITSRYYEDSITPVENFIIFYEDSSKYEYVTVDAKDYLYSKTLRIYPLFAVPNLQYRVSIDGGETYTNFEDIYEKKVFKNTSFWVEILDDNYNVIASKNFVTRGFEETEEIGSQLVFYEYEDPEDDTKRIISLKVININPNNYYFVQYGNSAYNRVYPLTWETGAYYFESTDQIISYCARITDSNLNVIKEECYMPKSLSETQLFSKYINKFIDFVDARTVQIMKISDTIDYIYLKLPEDYRTLLEFIYLAMCIGAIIWNLRK